MLPSPMPWWASGCAALARMLGLSRSRCAELAGDGYVLINGVTVAGKSDRLGADITKTPSLRCKPTPVTDMGILYDDETLSSSTSLRASPHTPVPDGRGQVLGNLRRGLPHHQPWPAW